MSDNVQLAQELVDARAAVASQEYADRAQRIADIEAEAAQLKGIIAAADARLHRAAVAVAEIGNAEAYEAGFAAALALVAAQAETDAAAAIEAAATFEAAPVAVEVAVEAPVEVAVEVIAEEAPAPVEEILPGLVLTVE